MISEPKAPFATKVGDVLKSYLSGPDGVSLAPGRLMGFLLFFVVLWAVIFIILNVANGPHTLQDWVTLMNTLMVFVPAMAMACIGLILGIAPTDSGGKWWDKNASPPPPPSDANLPPPEPGK